jgi:putative chitinase
MIKLTTIADTHFKQSAEQSSALPDSHKLKISAGHTFVLATCKPCSDGQHSVIELADFGINGHRKWHVFQKHCKILGSSERLVSLENLKAIANNSSVNGTLKHFVDAVNETLHKYEINTPLRIAHFLSQVFHESGGFQYMREIWGPTAAQAGYEGRTDLGNTQPGDGSRFRGRGLIQLTGRANYAQFSKDMGVDFIEKPELVENPPYAIMVAGWYWDSRNINKLADQDDSKAVTRAINGGLNGYSDRIKYLERAKKTLGI